MTFTKSAYLLLCVVSLLTMGGCSQEENENSVAAPDPRTVEIRTASKLKSLTTGLNLTPEQEAQVKSLLTEENQAVEKINAEASQSGENRVIQMRAVRTNTYEKIRPLLTPEQSEKYEDVLNKLEGRRKRR